MVARLPAAAAVDATQTGHLVRGRLGAAAASQALWSEPRSAWSATSPATTCTPYVSYRFIGTEHIGLETVASTATQTAVPRTAWRCRTAEAARTRTVGAAMSAWGPLR
ncbi:hypothetical protein [Streptomyces mirabilis]|uniref:hypothetical protein n=1 Tax=Streptomyces mirabilis TaxID=68239 RepID=UPI003688EE6D